MTVIAVSGNTLWAVSLGIGLVAALVVAALLLVLVRAVDDIDRSVSGPALVAGKVAATRRHSSAPGDGAGLGDRG